MLLGNGVIITYGSAPWYGDMVMMDKEFKAVPNRLILPNTQLRFDDSIVANGTFDSEDKKWEWYPGYRCWSGWNYPLQ